MVRPVRSPSCTPNLKTWTFCVWARNAGSEVVRPTLLSCAMFTPEPPLVLPVPPIHAVTCACAIRSQVPGGTGLLGVPGPVWTKPWMALEEEVDERPKGLIRPNCVGSLGLVTTPTGVLV